MNDYRNRLQTMQGESGRDWFQMKKAGATARIDIFDEIGVWGISAGDFVSMLNDLNTATIELHLNSPGGDVYDGIAIYNALRDNEATVNVTVDGIAASAASFIAMAGDSIVMNRNSEMMLHDGWALCIGNAQDMLDVAARLDKISNNIASIYAERAGGTTEQWRAVMQEETWYSDSEAVEAGLATSVAPENDAKPSKNKFDLSIFNHAGRKQAPQPKLDTPNSKTRDTVSDSSKNDQENHRMTPDQLEAIGLAEDATDDEIYERLTGLAELETAATPDGDADKPDEVKPLEGDAPPVVEPEKELAGASAKLELPDGVAVIDKAQLERLQATAAKVDKMEAAAALKERDDFIVAAMADGKFAPAERKDWENIYDANPASAKALINKLAKNTIPVKAKGHGTDGDADSVEAEYPTEWANNLKTKQVVA